ncbi:LacI family transcriptional regulator [Anaerosolibacter carboniphilus]|uniref:LacI family transcriptional regulator n=1 Tax=Anaerosolibacter carboniphilus TaxID=1417629 RepID=A0A841KYR3_9FIRM|nr:LacI family DNA-binding transcriptional regulator [Anaerosolibacter carboniphilus]MBB6215279.1 LacI family transcriptional regulator [Anaerosolibacter carboniphilus]
MKQDKPTHVTLLQVAKHAGVSRSTASLALRGGRYVSAETREKVFESMRELGYVYDRSAASLRSKSSSSVGLVFADLDNPFYTALLIGINEQLNKYNITPLLGTTFESCAIQERLISTMLEYRVGGIILFAVPDTPKDLINRIKQVGIPVVLINRNFPERSFDYIGIDDLAAGQIATEHLIEKGHRQIAFIGGFSKLSSWRERKQGYINAHTKAGLDIDHTLIIEGAATRESGYELMEKILNFQTPPTAVFCYNDIVAIGAMMKLKERGLEPGYDMAILGVDDIPEASIFTPKLTTVSSFPMLRGARAASLLYQRMEGLTNEPPQSIIIQPELIIRESCSYKDEIHP